MYYNPYREELKDERLEVISDELRGDTKFILVKLHPKVINPCPNCRSLNTIKYGIRKRKIEISLLAHNKENMFSK